VEEENESSDGRKKGRRNVSGSIELRKPSFVYSMIK
jgi:hypothetical protein